MSRAGWPHGKPVVDGVLRYSSPSTLTTSDPASDGGCLRKAWYQVILGIRSPTSKSQQTGTDMHAEIEEYLKTGEKKLGPLAMSGFYMIPQPGPDLLVEKAICETLDTATVRAAGVPIVGFIDLVHARGTNQGGTSIEDVLDPRNTVEVLDWKTTSDVRWIKSAAQIGAAIPMVAYGKWVITVAPSTEHVRLSHCYFVTRGSARPRKVTLRVLPEQIEKNWEHVEGTARSLKHAVAESNPDRVPANLRACDKYGGCPAREVCSAGMHGGLRRIVGATAAQSLGDSTMGIDFLDQLRGAGNPPAAPPPPVAATFGLGGILDAPATPGVDSAAKAEARAAHEAAELAKIQAEEAAAKERQQFLALCDKIDQFGKVIPGLGFPHLGGDAAKVYAAAKGYQLNGGGYAGSGKLGTVKPDGSPGLMITSAHDMAALVLELEAHAKQVQAPVQAAPAGLLSPETPPSAAPQPPPAPQVMTITTPPDEPKAKKAKKAASPPPAEPVAATPAPAAQDVAGTPTAPGKPISLAPFVDHVVGSLQKHFEGQGWQIADIRCAPQESPLGFGKWKGGVHAHTLEQAPKLPIGAVLTIDTRGSEFAEIVAGALAQYARATGAFTLVIDAAVDGSVIRGIR